MTKPVASYLVRINLHQRDDLPLAAVAKPGTMTAETPAPVPTLEALERIVADALYDELQYHTSDSIKVSAERIDI